MRAAARQLYNRGDIPPSPKTNREEKIEKHLTPTEFMSLKEQIVFINSRAALVLRAAAPVTVLAHLRQFSSDRSLPTAVRLLWLPVAVVMQAAVF